MMQRILRGEMLEVRPVVFGWHRETVIYIGLDIQWRHSQWLLDQRNAPWVTYEDEF